MNAMQQNPSYSQRSRDFAWRRLDFRHSATRRPFTIQFYTEGTIAAKDINYKSVLNLNRWLQVVLRCEKYADPRCYAWNMEIIIMIVIFILHFFNSSVISTRGG